MDIDRLPLEQVGEAWRRGRRARTASSCRCLDRRARTPPDRPTAVLVPRLTPRPPHSCALTVNWMARGHWSWRSLRDHPWPAHAGPPRSYCKGDTRGHRPRRSWDRLFLFVPHLGGRATADRLGLLALVRGCRQPRAALLLHGVLGGPADRAVHLCRAQGLAEQRRADARVSSSVSRRAAVRAGQRDRHRLPRRGERVRRGGDRARAEPAGGAAARRALSCGAGVQVAHDGSPLG